MGVRTHLQFFCTSLMSNMQLAVITAEGGMLQ